MSKTTFLLLIAFCCSLFATAQNKKIKLDYSVTYEIPNKRKQTTDTITVSFNKEGTYLYANAPVLGDQFASTMFKRSQMDASSMDSHFILDTKKAIVYMEVSFNDSFVFFKMNMDDLLPMKKDPLNKEVELIAEKTSEVSLLFGKERSVYSIYPSSEPDKPINVIFDKEHSVDNNTIFKKFIQMMLNKTESNGSIDFNLPNGLLLQAAAKGKVVLKAIDIDTNPVEINFSHNFNISK